MEREGVREREGMSKVRERPLTSLERMPTIGVP